MGKGYVGNFSKQGQCVAAGGGQGQNGEEGTFFLLKVSTVVGTPVKRVVTGDPSLVRVCPCQ